MSICVFMRYEFKYLISPKQYFNLISAAGKRLKPDKHGKSTIQSLYFDTDNFRLIRRSIEKPEYKEKMRLRSYGLVGKDDKAFIELKKKCSGVVYKRRMETSENALMKKEFGETQIAKEIAYFFAFYQDLSPKMLIIYDRAAYFGEGDLRVTFDSNIRYRTDRLSLSSGLDGMPLLPCGKILMEIKTGTAIPLWLSRILSREKIVKTSFSKYGEAYKKEHKPIIMEDRKIG